MKVYNTNKILLSYSITSENLYIYQKEDTTGGETKAEFENRQQ